MMLLLVLCCCVLHFAPLRVARGVSRFVIYVLRVACCTLSVARCAWHIDAVQLGVSRPPKLVRCACPAARCALHRHSPPPIPPLTCALHVSFCTLRVALCTLRFARRTWHIDAVQLGVSRPPKLVRCACPVARCVLHRHSPPPIPPLTCALHVSFCTLGVASSALRFASCALRVELCTLHRHPPPPAPPSQR